MLKYFFSFCVVAALTAPTAVEADVLLPKKGMQYFTAGMSLNPGVMHDDSAGDLDDVSTLSPAASGMLDVGLTQIINTSFFMTAEASLGMQWFNDHTAAREGEAGSSSNLAWQVGLMGNWLPFDEELGLVGGAGLHLFQAHLSDAPMQVLGGDLRVGRYIWAEDEQFLLLHLGYSAPLIQGLNRPDQFGEGDDFADRNWTFHRFTLGFQYGF